jgi:uncharacterized membrane protein YphA (DoxX/SURF4 family)
MKATKILYWVLTGVISLMMLYSGYAYLNNPQVAQTFTHLGYPGYFRVELAIGKIVGVALLLSPVPPRVKEWVYAGFGITFVSAFIAHTVSGDPLFFRIMTLIFLALLVGSYLTYHKLLARPA